MRELILPRTKKFDFMFNGETFTQVDGVAIGTSLAPILGDTCIA